MVAIERVRAALQDCYRTAVVVIIRLPDCFEVVAYLAPVLAGVGIHLSAPGP